jgi:hypothetical protein
MTGTCQDGIAHFNCTCPSGKSSLQTILWSFIQEKDIEQHTFESYNFVKHKSRQDEFHL